MLDAVRDAVVVVDTDSGMIVEANRAAESLCGRSSEELRSLHHSRLYTQDAHVPGLAETTVLHRDGHRIPVEISSSHVTAADGRRLLVGVFHDISDRNAARESLRRSEERFRRTAEGAGAFIWEVDAEGLYVYASPVVEQMLGYTPEELVGRLHFYDLFSPESRDELKAAAFEVFSRREPFRAFLNWNVRKDGRLVALETSGVPVLNESGALLGYCGADTEVTERIQAEEALRESEKIYRAIGESIDYGIWICAPDGRNTYASESFLKLVGLTQEQCSDFGWGQVLPPQDAERTLEAWQECVRSEGRWEVESRFRGSDGEWHPVLIRGVPVRDESGQITCWAGISLDISTLKRAQESLRASESQARVRAAELQAVMDAAPAVIFIAHDAECRRITGNRAACALLRRKPGSNLSKFAAGAREPFPELPVYSAAATGRPVRNCELDIDLEDGSCVHLFGNAEPMLDAAGSPAGAVAVLSDISEHKRAEAALRESEERFRNMADTAPVMIWVSGPDKLCTFFNSRWLEFTGRTMEQEAGDGWTSSLHPEDLDRCLTAYHSAFDARERFQVEYRLRRADGTYRWLLDTGIPRYRHGDFTGYIGSCVDVTEQKLIEEKLRANEIQLLDAQRLAKVGSSQIDMERGTVYWSDEMFRIFGFPNDVQPEFSRLLSQVHPKDRESVLLARDQAASSTAPVHSEFRVVRPDGELRFVRSVVEAVRNDRGVPVRFVVATQDVTEEIRARELLRESEERLRNAERIAHVGNWRWDVRSKRVFWSEELFRIFGTSSAGDANYQTFIDAVVPQDRKRVDDWVQQCLGGGRSDALEFRIARPDGEVRTVASIIEVLRDEDGSPVHVSGTCQDITEVRHTQEQAFARQKLESVGTLAGGIAHDFNNLLGGVAALADVAFEELASGSRPEQELTQIRDVAMQGSEIVRQLMIYAGKENENPELVNVSTIVQAMYELLRVSVSKRASLDTDLGDNVPAIRSTAAQIRRIVMNLATNAAEAIGDHDGSIRVVTRRVLVDAVSAATQGLTAGEYLQLEVRDDGCGIAREAQARIFDPFFTTKSAGRGLGLPVVQGIVRNLAGGICVFSEPGKGTSVQVLLPSAQMSGTGCTSMTQETDEAVAPARPATILVVEDEHPLRHAVAKMLHREQFQVLEASDGTTAVDLLHNHDGRIDAILLDMTIPGRSSQEVISEALQSRPNVQVLLTSAYTEEMVMTAISSPLIHGFIRKPFRLRELAQRLRSLLA